MGRPRKSDRHLPSRVYIHGDSYTFIDKEGTRHHLCAIAAGEAALLRALAKHKVGGESKKDSWAWWLEKFKESKTWKKYAQSTRYDYDLLWPKISHELSDFEHIKEIEPKHVVDLRDLWADTERTADKVHSMVSLVMAHAAERGGRPDNPCLNVKKLSPSSRDVYMTNGEFWKIRDALQWTTDKRSPKPRRVATGAVMQCGWDLGFLTMQREGDVFAIDPTTDIVDEDLNPLRWDDMPSGLLKFRPSKTAKSTGKTVLVPITPEIAAVLERAKGERGKLKVANPRLLFCSRRGKRYTRWAVAKAVRVACARVGIVDRVFRDLRAKAQTDASMKHGYTMEQIQKAAVHASVTTTEGYIKGVAVETSPVKLPMPRAA